MTTDAESHATIADTLKRTFKARRSFQPYAEFLRGFAVVEQAIRQGDYPEHAVATTVEAGLSQLMKHAPHHAELLRSRWEGASMGNVAQTANRVESNLYKKEELAFFALASVLAGQERALRRDRKRQWLRALPQLDYTHLVGTTAKIEQLLPHFRHEDAPWIIALVGMGGVGKTTLAHTLISELVAGGRFDRVAWVSAQQSQFSLDGTIQFYSDRPALSLETMVGELGRHLMGYAPEQWQVPVFDKEAEVQDYLLATPSIVVVDNLETVSDMNGLLPFLRSTRGASKFILTSRVTPHQVGDIFNYSVPPLTFEESLTLIHKEAQNRNIAGLLNCSTEIAYAIYDATGGNPLALRLVVGQIDLHGLLPVLTELRHARGVGASLYRYLYDWVWQTLSGENRAVLHALLLLTDENSTADAIQQFTGLPSETILQALQQLITQNLVTLQGTMETRRYTLHNLTRAFLEEINRTHGPNDTPDDPL
jgi:hypothetical protein